jgi:hypothetical protein
MLLRGCRQSLTKIGVQRLRGSSCRWAQPLLALFVDAERRASRQEVRAPDGAIAQGPRRVPHTAPTEKNISAITRSGDALEQRPFRRRDAFVDDFNAEVDEAERVWKPTFAPLFRPITWGLSQSRKL